jgi:hypothetical protein
MRGHALFLVAALAVGCGGSDVSRELGARCDDSTECDDRCLLPGEGWPGGFCTISCDSDADCPADSLCADGDGGACRFDCQDDDGCAFLGEGWVCEARASHPAGSEVMVCVGS